MWLVVWNICYFPYDFIGKNHPNWLSFFFRGIETTNQSFIFDSCPHSPLFFGLIRSCSRYSLSTRFLHVVPHQTWGQEDRLTQSWLLFLFGHERNPIWHMMVEMIRIPLQWYDILNTMCGYSNNKPPFFDGFYHPFMVIRDCLLLLYQQYHVLSPPNPPKPSPRHLCQLLRPKRPAIPKHFAAASCDLSRSGLTHEGCSWDS